MNTFKHLAIASALAISSISAAHAAIVTIPNSALIASTTYYTDTIGGGIGNVVVMTGGGNAANVGNPSGRNDDGYAFMNLPFSVNFFGTSYSSIYLNNNGNVSFGSGISAYVPTGPTGVSAPIISPFFGDVDTRNAASGTLHVRTDIANQIIVTWDNVGYFNSHADRTDSFQLVLRSAGYVLPAGEGAIGFWYKGMGWDATDTNTVAATGFGDGAGNGEVLEGSTQRGLNNIVANHHIWFDANLVVVPPTDPNPPTTGVPEPESLALLGLGVLGLGLARRRKQA